MSAQIRKTYLNIETTLIEGGRAAPKPLRLIAAAAVLKNPWAGRGFVEDLKPEIHAVAPELGALLTAMILEAAGGETTIPSKRSVCEPDITICSILSLAIRRMRRSNSGQSVCVTTTGPIRRGLNGPPWRTCCRCHRSIVCSMPPLGN